MTFLRSTPGKQKWLCAVTDDLKLVFSTSDAPWLFDLSKDPDELRNCFAEKAYGDRVRKLSRALRRYCDTYVDPYVAIDKIAAEIAAASK